MNWFKKILVFLRLRQLKTDHEIVDLVKKGLEKAKFETKPACEHPILRKVLPKDLWYICHKCKTVFFVHGAEGWDLRQIPKVIEGLEKGLGLKK